MTSKLSFSLHLNVRTKILLVFLGLSVLSLLVTGFVAMYTITGVGTLAESGSTSLGREAVNDSSAALRASAEQNLLRVASGQAAVTEVVFSDTESAVDILAAHAAYLQLSPPDRVTAPWFVSGETHPAPVTTSAVIFVPGTSVTPQSEEFRSLAGMAHLLQAQKEADPDLETLYVATDSGVMWMYPGTDDIPADYDPRTRDWFRDAELSRGRPVWSEPYVDAGGRGLIMTCSRSVSGRSGTWVIATDVTIDSINANILNLTLNGAGYPVLVDQKGTVISRPGLTANGTTSDLS